MKFMWKSFIPPSHVRHPIFISYSSTAVMKYQDQGNLEKEESSSLKGQLARLQPG